MMEIFIKLVGVLSDKQVDVVVAVMELLSASIVAVFGLLGSVLAFIFNKRSERKIELRKIKEKQYIEFLGNLAETRIAKNDEKHKINMLLSSRVQTIYLVGNEEVQNALHNFLKYFTESKTDKNEQNKLYGILIKAMKKDLYGKKEESLESILFTVFDD